MESRPRERGSSLLVLVIGLVIVGLVAWLVISRLQESREMPGAGELGTAAPMDHSRQARTIIDMQIIGRALALIQVDKGAYPRDLSELESGGYLALVPLADAWGSAWIYEAGEGGYTLTSLGADGQPGPAPPSPWTTSAYDCDLVLANGQMKQAPAGH